MATLREEEEENPFADFDFGNAEFQSEENPFRISELDPSKQIVVYCGVGGQGALSAKTLKDMGFKNVSNLEGGVKAWKDSGQNTT